MNERIKLLANQAVGKRSCYMIEAEYIKFAELIVKECAMVAYRKGFCQKCKGGQYISSDIRNHFRS